MAILVSHNTALEMLRSVPPQLGALPRVDHPVVLEGVRARARDVHAANLRELGVRRSPTHVLLPADEREIRSVDVRSHRTRLDVVPERLLLGAAPGVYVAGPELCFIQMAGVTSRVGAVVLGYELCGEYAHFSELVSGYYEREPLTSVARISAAIDALEGRGGLRGAGVARAALEWVCDGARSPMETVVSAEMYLPRELQGLGFVRPELNFDVALDEVAAAITGTRRCSVDVAWPARRRGLEYDSREFHLDPARDLRRREALEHMGWTINVIDLDQMADHRELMKTVALFEDDVERQPGGSAPPEEVAQLHARLLRATRCGLGLERALFGVPVGRDSVRLHL